MKKGWEWNKENGKWVGGWSKKRDDEDQRTITKGKKEKKERRRRGKGKC